MTPAETEHFRTLLSKERAEIQANLATLQEELGEVEQDTDEPSDEGDEAQDLISSQENSTEIALLRTTLAQVEKALMRIRDGSYGFSEISGKPIPVERLEALPTATTLVDEVAPSSSAF